MKPIEKINEILDFSSHIRYLQDRISTCKKVKEESSSKDLKYWEDCLEELLKVRNTVEVKIYKSKLIKKSK